MDPTALHDHLTPRVEAFLGFFDFEPMEPPEVDSDGRAVVDIRGVIGVHIDGSELAPLLRDTDATTLEVHIDSGGGNVWDGVAIANALRQHPATIEVHVDAMAASAASVIAMSGDTVIMHPGAMMMVHNARGFADSATAEDCRALAELLDKINVNMSEIYANRAGGTPAAWLEVMAGEEWFTGEEAIAAGLADQLATAAAVDPEVEASALDLTEVFGYQYNGRTNAPAPDLGPVADAIWQGALSTDSIDLTAIDNPNITGLPADPPDEPSIADLLAELYPPPQPDPAAFAVAVIQRKGT